LRSERRIVVKIPYKPAGLHLRWLSAIFASASLRHENPDSTEAAVMEVIAILFFAGLTFGLPIAAVVVLIVLHRRHRDLAAKTNRLQQELSLATTDVRLLESRVQELEQKARSSKAIPTLEITPDEVGELTEVPSVASVEPSVTAQPLPEPPPALQRSVPSNDETPPAPAGVTVPQALKPTQARPAQPPTRPAHGPSRPAALRPSAGSISMPSSGAGFERQLGTKVAVWVGAIALTFAGIFLVKYTIEQGLLGPTARVALGLGFGVTLLASAEWMRRRSAGVAQGLAASGIAVLFAALLAGVKLYGLIPPTVGFLGLLLTTATAVVLSMRHGQMVAILGLLGGFLTPLFIGSETPRPWMLFTYLLLIQTGLLLVSRKMRWWPVAGLSLIGGMGWAALWISDLATVGGGSFPVGLFLMASIFSYVLLATGMAGDEKWGELNVPLGLVWGGAGIGLLLLCALVGVGDFGLMEWAFLGVLGAGCLVLGRREHRYEGLPWLAALMSAGMLLLWGTGLVSTEQSRLGWIAAAMAALYVGGSYVALWGSLRPERWAALSGVSAVAYLLVAYAGLGDAGAPLPWGATCLGLAAILCGLAVPVAKRRSELPHGNAALAAFAVAATALVSLAVPMELKREWIGVAWALQIPALAWIAARLRLPALGNLAWGLGGMVGLRLLLNPAILTYSTGDGVVFNWLLYGYGLPLAAFAAGAILFRRLGDERLSRALEVGSILLGLAYVSLSVRQFFHPGDLDSATFFLSEWGAFTVVWLLFALGMLGLHRLTERALYLNSAAVIGILALAQGLAVQGLAQNPLLQSHPVGEFLIFNRLLFVYGLPATLAGLMALVLARIGEPIAARLTGCGALAFAFATLTLEVRQAFHGTLLDAGTTSNAEMYSYSLAWILFATALLVAGILSRGTVLRYASAVVMALAVGKVFLIDTAHLQDLYRVVSLLGLGVSLMLLAFLYQKFVFGEVRR
jgi:uncharacterized membrane protein